MPQDAGGMICAIMQTVAERVLVHTMTPLGAGAQAPKLCALGAFEVSRRPSRMSDLDVVIRGTAAEMWTQDLRHCRIIVMSGGIARGRKVVRSIVGRYFPLFA